MESSDCMLVALVKVSTEVLANTSALRPVHYRY